MCCFYQVTTAEEMEAKTESGLIKGHAYGITAVKTVKLADTGLMGMFNKQKIYLVRLRNPWGEKEWNGAWSDGYVVLSLSMYSSLCRADFLVVVMIKFSLGFLVLFSSVIGI